MHAVKVEELCCWMPPARQPRDELSVYSHPLAGCRRENSLLSGLADSHSDGTGGRETKTYGKAETSSRLIPRTPFETVK